MFDTNDLFHRHYSNCKEDAHMGQQAAFIFYVIMIFFVQILQEAVRGDVKFIIHQLLFGVKRWAAANNYSNSVWFH